MENTVVWLLTVMARQFQLLFYYLEILTVSTATLAYIHVHLLPFCYCSVDVIAPPTPVNSLASIADSQTSLFIQWAEPDLSYVANPLLVSYTLYYSTQRPLNYSESPSIANLRVGSNGEGTYLLTGLQRGTVYYMGMRAENEAGTSDNPSFTQIATTYGNGMT